MKFEIRQEGNKLYSTEYDEKKAPEDIEELIKSAWCWAMGKLSVEKCDIKDAVEFFEMVLNKYQASAREMVEESDAVELFDSGFTLVIKK